MRIEPWPHSNVKPNAGEHELLSVAISLKRIADSLEILSKSVGKTNSIYGGCSFIRTSNIGD